MGSSEEFTVDVTPGWDAMGDPMLSLEIQGHEKVVFTADDAEQLALNMLRQLAVARMGGGWFRNLVLSGIPADVARRIVDAGGYIPLTHPET